MVQLWNTTTDKFVLTFLHILPFNIWNHSFQGTPDELLHLFPSGFLFEQTLAKGLGFLRMEKKKTKCWQIRASFQKCLAPLFSPISQQISWHPRNQLHVKLDPITKLSSLCFEFWRYFPLFWLETYCMKIWSNHKCFLFILWVLIDFVLVNRNKI